MSKIYEQHDAAFANVSAYIIVKNGERIAKVAFKYPRDGAGRLYAYVHVFGTEMVRGFAGGYGYDKASAAVENACSKLGVTEPGHLRSAWMDTVEAFRDPINHGGDGIYWNDRLRAAGFDVWQVV
jgi:hypothetical protein